MSRYANYILPHIYANKTNHQPDTSSCITAHFEGKEGERGGQSKFDK